ncbi:hypothetical protein cypCar_00028760 [Cyprinus carpio]|nr:hypothetical protein cypCar_00028760 [Cyprinus carpio]
MHCVLCLKFCEIISVAWMAHLAGRVVQTLLDYVNHVDICSKLQRILERQEEWPDICETLTKAARVFEMSMATIAAIGNTTVRAYNEDSNGIDTSHYDPGRSITI